MIDSRHVQGYCPMGCGNTLFLGSGGYVTCGYLPCPNPTAVSDILGVDEHEHIVIFTDDQYTVRHPLRERVNNELEQCQLHQYIANLGGPPVSPGMYRAWAEGHAWSWQRIAHHADSDEVDPPTGFPEVDSE